MLLSFVWLAVTQTGAPEADIPEGRWVRSYFGSESDRQSIHGRAKLSQLPNLWKKLLPDGEEEIRIWEGFGLTWLEGIRLKKSYGRWSAWHIVPIWEKTAHLSAKNFLIAQQPIQGWDGFWKAMESQNLLGLPDFDALPGDKATVLDGVCYVVEIQRNGKYRAYMYNNPKYQPKKWKELDQMLKIVDILYKSFPSLAEYP